MSKPLRETIDDLGTAKLTRDRDRLREANAGLTRNLAAAQERIELLERIDSLVVEPPDWTVGARSESGHRGILNLLLSDCHFDEMIDPHQVEGSNAFNREIAVMRLRRTLERVIVLARQYFAGVQYEGFVLQLGGDMLSGSIHEELIETNEDTVYGSVDFWSDHLAAFVQGLMAEFKKVHVVGVVGNHGRRTRKPAMKRRVRDNLDWLLYRMVARATPGVTWQLPESADADFKVYGTRFRLTHGDQFRGGSGIAGFLSPILLGQHRKAQRQNALGQPFDWLVMGHWHQYIHGRGIIVNGSLKGYDEYAYTSNFGFEPPMQAFWLVTPEHGASLAAPIFCQNRRKEKW